MNRPAIALLLTAVTIVDASCSDSSAPDTTPASLTLVSGNAQTGRVGLQLGAPLIVRVANAGGEGLAGVTVTWRIVGGGGSLASTPPTDSDGHASVTWTLGTVSGTDNNSVTATITALPDVVVAFIATATPGPPTRLTVISGNNQTGEVGVPLTQPLVVAAGDQFDNRLAGTTIDWGVSAGAGELSSTSTVTAADGQTSVTWTIGTTAGTTNNTATAVIRGVSASRLTFAASGTHGAPTRFDVVSGSDQTAPVGAALPNALTVRVSDAHGNPVPMQSVEWSVVEGGGSLAPASATTNGAGTASATWTMGTTAGLQIARVNSAGSTLFFNATARAGPPARITIVAGNNQTGTAGLVLPNALRVHVVDGFGNNVSGTVVEWSIVSGGGSLSNPTDTELDGTTTIRWTLGPTPGDQRVLAAVPLVAGATVEFTATAVSTTGVITGVVTLESGLLAAGRGVRAASGLRTPAASTMVRTSAPIASTKLSSFAGRDPSQLSVVRARQRPSASFVADELIVTYRNGTVGGLQPGTLAQSGPAGLNAVAADMRSRLASHERVGRLRVLGASPVVRAARVRVADPATIDSVAAVLRREPGVASVERNRFGHIASTATPARSHVPPRVRATVANDFLYPFQAWHYAMIDLPDAWDITTGTTAVIVAVVDDGIRFDHPDIASNLTNDGYDFVSSTQVSLCAGGTVDAAGDGDGVDPDPTIPTSYDVDPVLDCVLGPASLGGHGLHVAGTIGAVGNNGAGVSGINWTVRIRPVRVMNTLGRGTSYDIAQGLLYAAGLPADNGAGGIVQAPSRAHIINMSIGGPDSEVKRNAVAQATAAGSLIIAAAGNDASSVPHFPAAYDEVLSVSAVGPDALLASYSSFGPTVDIAAPGGDLADGDCTFGVTSTMWNFASSQPTYVCAQGTSMAAPHVAGVAALVLAQSPGLSSAQLRSRLVDWAVDFGASGRDDQFGAGIVNAHRSLMQGVSPPRQLYAQLYSATTGSIVSRLATQSGAFTFGSLAADDYLVFAGEDVAGDARLGIPGRRWGAFGGSGRPTPVTIAGDTRTASFSVAFPIEAEPNDDADGANALPLGGYLLGTLGSPPDADFVRVIVPELGGGSVLGTYTFETSPVAGACGFALEEDTSITLFDFQGGVLATNHDINESAGNFCSRITIQLVGGRTYYLRVSGLVGGRYRLAVRPAS